MAPKALARIWWQRKRAKQTIGRVKAAMLQGTSASCSSPKRERKHDFDAVVIELCGVDVEVAHHERKMVTGCSVEGQGQANPAEQQGSEKQLITGSSWQERKQVRTGRTVPGTNSLARNLHQHVRKHESASG